MHVAMHSMDIACWSNLTVVTLFSLQIICKSANHESVTQSSKKEVVNCMIVVFVQTFVIYMKMVTAVDFWIIWLRTATIRDIRWLDTLTVLLWCRWYLLRSFKNELAILAGVILAGVLISFFFGFWAVICPCNSRLRLVLFWLSGGLLWLLWAIVIWGWILRSIVGALSQQCRI